MPNQDIYFPKKLHTGYFDKALQKHFNTKQEKRDYMNAHNLREDGSMESQRHRNHRIYETVNEERKKKGLPTQTKEQMFPFKYQ